MVACSNNKSKIKKLISRKERKREKGREEKEREGAIAHNEQRPCSTATANLNM